MKKKSRIVPAAFLAAALLSACTNQADHESGSAAPAAPKATDGALEVDGLRIAVAAKFLGGADVAIAVRVMDAEGNPIETTVRGDVVMPAMGSMAEMKSQIPFGAPASVHDVRFTLDMQGKWFVTLHVMGGGKHATLYYSLNTVSKQFVFDRSVPPAGGSEAQSAGGQGGVFLSPQRRQLIGVTFAPVERRTITQNIRAFGRVAVNEQSLAAVNMQAGGWVRKVFVKDTGARVKAGEPLMTVYSPELKAAQEELLIAASGDDEALLSAAESKLKALGMDESQIRDVRRRGKARDEVTIRAPRDGFVVEKEVIEGARIEAGMPAFRIGTLGRVWIRADVFESDASRVRQGQKARIRIAGAPEEVDAEVSYVYPTVDEMTRTLPVRIEVRNPAETLKPGMAVDIAIAAPLPASLAVPRAAVLASGEHRYVFVDRGDGYLEPREIKTGGGNDEWLQVTEGLEAGEHVSTSGNFLISSEAQLQNALPKWAPASRGDGGEGSTGSSDTGAATHEHHH